MLVRYVEMLCASAVLSLLLEDFFASLTESQHAKLIEIYQSNNPDDNINDDVAINLISLFKTKKNCLRNVEPLLLGSDT